MASHHPVGRCDFPNDRGSSPDLTYVRPLRRVLARDSAFPDSRKKLAPEAGLFIAQLPATGAEAEAYARPAAVIAVSAIVIATPAVVSVAPAHHVPSSPP